MNDRPDPTHIVDAFAYAMQSNQMTSIPSGESWVERMFVDADSDPRYRTFKAQVNGEFAAVPCEPDCDCYRCAGFGPVEVKREPRTVDIEGFMRAALDGPYVYRCKCPDVCMCHVERSEVDALPKARRCFE